MLNILLISPWLPWPPHDGARIRILETLRYLSGRHRVTLFAHIHAESERNHVAKLLEYCEEVHVTLLSTRTDRRVGRMARAMLTGAPLIQGIHFDAGLAQRITATTEQRKFDVVQIELSLIARYAAAVSRRHGSKLVLSTHNIESQRFERELKLSSWSLRRVVLLADKLLFGRWEEKTVKLFDGAVAVSDQDRQWLKRHLGGRPVALAPNGVDTGYFQRRAPTAAGSNTVVFTGVMDYPPNEDAVLWFADAAWPLLRHRWPDLVFQIVGTRPTARVAALAGRAGIEVTGEVPDVRPYVEQALAFVVPLRSGGGTRLKILQAMAIGCPVISTRLGAEGLAVCDSDNILFAEQPAEFVARIEDLKVTPELADRLAGSARALVLQRYDWKSCLSALDVLYRAAEHGGAIMRVRLCYAAPGHSLLSSAGPTRNILATAAALAEWVDVTVAFWDLGEPHVAAAYRVIAIAPSSSQDPAARDDVAARGLNPLHHWRYLRALRRFAAESAGDYDLVLEKGWRLSGYLARAFARRGTPAVLIENDARLWNEPLRDLRSVARFAAHLAAQRVARRCSRSLPLVIAETEELKSALIAERHLAPGRVQVVPLGVDHALFRPLSQIAARAELGLSKDALIMLYVGGMDQYHDLSPLLEALGNVVPANLELHLVGDGVYCGRYRDLAKGSSVPVHFHGQVGHAAVPTFIAAADVCLAPYQTSGFHGGQVSFSTLKIPEYMACERPVISVPSGNILSLIEDGVTGFLFPNELAAWRNFLTPFPDRVRFAEMGRAAAPKVASLSWSATAQRYLQMCSAAIGKNLL